jgi:hypothetical protein
MDISQIKNTRISYSKTQHKTTLEDERLRTDTGTNDCGPYVSNGMVVIMDIHRDLGVDGKIILKFTL